MLLFAALVLVTHSNTFDVGFVLDNRTIILNAPQVHAATAQNIKLILTHSYWWPKATTTDAYRPLTTLSFLFNYAVLGNADRPAGYHWVNLGLHWGNVVLVYLLMLRLGGSLLTALLAAALFAVHPITTEAVTNLVGRADLLATAAVLGTLLLYIRCQSAPRKRWWRLSFLLTATAGLLCKESAATVLGVMVLYDVLFRLGSKDTASPRQLVARLARCAGEGWALLLPPFAMVWAVRHWVIHQATPMPTLFSENLLIATDFLTARLTAIKVVGQSLWQLLWPARLCCDYSVGETQVFGWDLHSWPDQQALLALLVLLAIAVVAIALWRRGRPVVFCIGFFFITLLPTSNLIVLIYSVRADRFLYLPSVGAAGCVALAAGAVAEVLGRWSAGGAQRRPRWPAATVSALLGAAVVALAARTYVRNRDWRDNVTLCTRDVQSCPNSFRMHRWLAAALYASDRSTNIDTAIDEAEAAQAILDGAAPPAAPVPSAVLEDLTIYYETKASLVSQPERRGWYAKAASALERAIAIQRSLAAAQRQNAHRHGERPAEIAESADVAPLYLKLGEVNLRLGEPHKAVEALSHAQRLAPRDADIHAALGTAYTAAGDTENAILSLLQAFLCDKNRQDIWPRLFTLYQEIDPGGCAFVQTAGQYHFNHACPVVHRDICAALARQVDALVAAGDHDGARDVRDAAVELHNCLLDEADGT